jgi:hypothetical protein
MNHFGWQPKVLGSYLSKNLQKPPVANLKNQFIYTFSHRELQHVVVMDMCSSNK